MVSSEHESDESGRKFAVTAIARESPEQVIFSGTGQDHPFE
jgi:hypothetical protein